MVGRKLRRFGRLGPGFGSSGAASRGVSAHNLALGLGEDYLAGMSDDPTAQPPDEARAQAARQQAVLAGAAGFLTGAGLVVVIVGVLLAGLALGLLGLAFKFIFMLWH